VAIDRMDRVEELVGFSAGLEDEGVDRFLILGFSYCLHTDQIVFLQEIVKHRGKCLLVVGTKWHSDDQNALSEHFGEQVELVQEQYGGHDRQGAEKGQRVEPQAMPTAMAANTKPMSRGSLTA
jgi:hypothetical protein